MGDHFYLIAVKNDGMALAGDDSASSATVGKMRKELQTCADVHRFEIPELKVGTLEKLMTAGDLLQKVDLNVENVLRKIERQYEELNLDSEKLGIKNDPPEKYLENFRWNAAKYPTQRGVDDLVRNIVSTATKTEVELKESAAFFQEKKQKVQMMERQREGSLLVANLDEALTPKLDPKQIHDSVYLRTVVVVVPKSKEKDFLGIYETLGSDLVGYGPESDRNSIKGSPVVPQSAERITEDKEGYIIYLMTILKKFFDDLKTPAQTNGFVIRDYNFEKSYEAYERVRLEGDGVDQLTIAKREEDDSRFQLLHWCKSHYGEVFMAWIHTKALRVFVESVLRYGLPVNFAAAVVKPKKRTDEKKMREKLGKLYATLDQSGMMQMHADDAGIGGEEMFPYVSYTFQPEKAD